MSMVSLNINVGTHSLHKQINTFLFIIVITRVYHSAVLAKRDLNIAYDTTQEVLPALGIT